MIIGEGPFFGPPKTLGSTLTVGGPILAADGLAAAPSYAFTTRPATGMFYVPGTIGPGLSSNGSIFLTCDSAVGSRANVFSLGLSSNIATTAADVILARSAAASLTIGGFSNGQLLGVKQLTELTTIAAAATTDTTIQIPANAIVIGVTMRVTIQPPGTATTDVGVAGSTTRYATGASTTVGTTTPGTIDGLRYYGSAISVRYTPNASPSDATGRIRTTIHYLDITPATS